MQALDPSRLTATHPPTASPILGEGRRSARRRWSPRHFVSCRLITGHGASLGSQSINAQRRREHADQIAFIEHLCNRTHRVHRSTGTCAGCIGLSTAYVVGCAAYRSSRIRRLQYRHDGLTQHYFVFRSPNGSPCWFDNLGSICLQLGRGPQLLHPIRGGHIDCERAHNHGNFWLELCRGAGPFRPTIGTDRWPFICN